MQRAAGVAGVEAGDQVVQVARGERHDGRVEHRGARALVLAELRVDLARDREVAEVGLQRQPERVLVSRVRIRVEQADRDTLDAAGLELRHHGLDLRQGKGDEHRAVGTDPLADLETEVARHQGLGLGGQIEPVEVAAVLARDLEDITEAPRGDEPHRRPAPLDDGIRHERGPMSQARPRRRLRPEGGEAVQHRCRRARRGRRHLARPHRARRIPRHQVREGPTHVDADPDAGGHRHRHALSVAVAGRAGCRERVRRSQEASVGPRNRPVSMTATGYPRPRFLKRPGTGPIRW